MTVHVILPVHNRKRVTDRFIEFLKAQTFQDFRLLLVDDGCTDGTVEAAKASLGRDQLAVLTGDGNLWWAGALQLAFDHLRANPPPPDDAVLIINDDLTFSEDFLARGLTVLAEHPAACIQALGVESKSRVPTRGVIADLAGLRFRGARPEERIDCLATRGLLMSVGTFLQSGGFVPKWLPHYLSDYEFTFRLGRRGTPLLCDDRFALEFDGESTGYDDRSANGIRDLWAKSLSNRAKYNPKHWTVLALLICPPRLAIWHALKIWLSFARRLVRAAFARDSLASRTEHE